MRKKEERQAEREYQHSALMRLIGFLRIILYIHSMVIKNIIRTMNLGRELLIPYLTVQKLSNGLGELLRPETCLEYGEK